MRYRLWERHVDGRLIEQRVADDYRVVNGIPYPFTFIITKWNDKGDRVFNKTTIVDKAEFNGVMPESDFVLSIGPGNVTDLARHITVPLRSQRDITLVELARLGAELHDENVEWNRQEMELYLQQHPEARHAAETRAAAH